MSQPRIFQVDRRLIVSTGRARAEVVEALCAATVEELELNEPKAVTWSCQASEDRGYFVAVFEKLRDGAPAAKRLSHEQLEKAFSAVRISFQRQTDPTMIDAYEARTLEGATTATEINVPPPKGGVQVLGRLLSVTYDGTLQGQDALWEHKFDESARPMLTADEAGRLFLVGGRYRVDDVGIVDKVPEELPGGFEAVDVLEAESSSGFFEEVTSAEFLEEPPAPGAPGAEVFGDPAEIEDAIELGRFSERFLEAVPNANEQAIQQGLAMYEQLHAELHRFTPLEQAQAAAAIFLFRGSKASYNAERMNAALGRVERGHTIARGRQISEALTVAIFGTRDAGKWTGDVGDRENLRDAKAAAVFGSILNEVLASELHPVVAGIDNLKGLKKPELAGLARLALGSAPPGEKSWSATTKAKLLDVLEHETGAEANPAFSRAPAGEGGRFAACVRKMKQREDVYDPKGLCASIGRRKYGAKEFAKMAKRGRANPGRGSDQLSPRCEAAAQQLYSRASELYELRREAWDSGDAADGLDLARAYAAVKVLAAMRTANGRDRLDREILEQIEEAWERAKELRGNPYSPELRSRLSELGALTQSNPFEDDIIRALEHAGSKQVELRVQMVHALDEQLLAMDRFFGHDEIGGYRDYEDEILYDAVSAERDGFSASLASVEMLRRQLAATHANTGEWLEALAKLPPEDNPLGFQEEELEFGPVELERKRARPREGKRQEASDWLEAELERWKLENPKVDGRWHRVVSGRGVKLHALDAGDTAARIFPYQREAPSTNMAAQIYQRQHMQSLPKGTKWIAVTWANEGVGASLTRTSAHTTLAAAKKAAERAMKRVRSNPVVANAGLLAGAPARHEGFGLDGRLTNAGLLASPGGPHANSLGLPRVNAGLVDPPRVRRTMPRQP